MTAQRAWLKGRNNPLVFVRDVLGVTPEPWQAEALEAVGQHDRVSIRSGHGVGKTTLEAWLILWFLLTHQNCKIPVAANSQDQLRDTIWPEIAKWHRQLPDALKAMIDVQAERIVVVKDPEGAFAVRRTASKDNPEALQGFHAEHLLFLIDEASGIPDIVFEVGMGALSTSGAKVVMAGNPTRTSGFFYDTHHLLRDRWHTMHVSCLDVPRAQGHIDDIKAKYGESSNAYRVRVLGEFPTSDDETVIPLELVLSAVMRNVSALEYYPVWGVDVARFGPATAIREADSDGNALTDPDPSWSPRAGGIGGNPEYWSGHSIFSGAGAAALAGFFCNDAVPFSLTTDSAPDGVARTYPGFSAAAAEAGQSRIVGGIHFGFSNQEGLATGKAIAEEILATRLLRSRGPTHFGACPL